MSEENVELTKRAFAVFATGGVEATLPYFAPELSSIRFPNGRARPRMRSRGMPSAFC